jgi:hypothetical protein
MASRLALESLGSVVLLLHAAADETITLAVPAVGPMDPWQALLASRVDGARYLADELLDGRVDLAGLPDPVQTDPVQLLLAAWSLLQAAPLGEFPPGTARLVVEVADLIRTARAGSGLAAP